MLTLRGRFLLPPLGLGQLRKCSDTMWLTRQGPKRSHSSAGSLGMLALGIQPPRCEETSSHMERPHGGGPGISLFEVLAEAASATSWPFECFQPLPAPSWPYLPSLSCPSWGSKQHEAKTSHPHCTPSEFLTNRSHEYNKMVVILHQKILRSKPKINNKWNHVSFTCNVLSLLCSWVLLLFPEEIIQMLPLLWVPKHFVHMPVLWYWTFRLFTSSVLSTVSS